MSVHHCVGPPTKNKGPGENSQNGEEKEKPPSLDDFGLEYNRYLKEVVDALESDPEFRKKLETADEADFRNGKVAAELDYVNHHVRTKLDELKRTELQRLRDLVKQAEEIEKNEVNPNHVNPGHVDHTNPHTFEAADLHKLITQVRKDLAEADRKRREEFKQYELEKKFEQEQALKTMDEEHKKQYLEQLEKQKQRHLEQSRKVNHPGSRHQLEGVWETQDQMHDQKFNPRTFFLLHDINGDGYWDEDEVKALFKGELDKLYQAGAPLEDMRERLEEMERMREHVFKESDTNGDRLISYEEFLEQTKKPEFQSGKDEGWEPLDAQPQFTQQEYEEFERRRQQEVQHLIDQGLIQHYPYPPGMMPPPPGYEHHPGQFQQAYQHPGAGHPNQIPQQQQQYAQNVAHHPQGVPPQAQYAHIPQGSHQYPAQHYPNQMPQHPNQLPRSNQPAAQSNQIPQSQPAPPQQNQVNQNIPQQPSSQIQSSNNLGQPQQNNPIPQQQQLYQQQAQQPNQQQYQQQAKQPNQQQYQQQAQQPNQQQYHQQAQQPNQQQYHHDPNQIIPPNPNQQILQNQQAPNYIPNQQAPSSNHIPSNQIPNQQIHASKQIPSQQAPVNAQQLNQVPQNQAGQQTNQGAYGSISMQQGANYQQNNIHTDGNKSPTKDIPPKR